jgi:hypothetical protein
VVESLPSKLPGGPTPEKKVKKRCTAEIYLWTWYQGKTVLGLGSYSGEIQAKFVAKFRNLRDVYGQRWEECV